jgi:hypothetical protein
MSTSNSTANATTINPINCVYGCNTRIYWNNLISEYWEVLTKKKHICPKRTSNNNKSISTIPTNSNNTAVKSTNYNKNYNDGYNYKKSWTPKFNNKQPMDNSLEILHGQADTIRKQYEILSDLIKKYNGKTHGSQSHILANNFIQIIVYYEVPEVMRDEVKGKFNVVIRNE